MTVKLFDHFWHRTLGRPYRLARPVDIGQGQPVVLLHGIGRTGNVWKHLVGMLVPLGHRVVALDLLGFGASPTPDWLEYSADDHASSVIASMEQLRLGQPVVLVGHSMGGLVAVRVARRRPDLVRHLVLYEMPLYKGLPETLTYRWRIGIYLRLHKWLKANPLSFDDQIVSKTAWLTRKIVGDDVDRNSWQPFIKSLENTIIHQDTAADLKALEMPIDVIYGSLDLLIIRGKEEQIFGADFPNATIHNVRARHTISPKASAFIASRIEASYGGLADPPVSFVAI